MIKNRLHVLGRFDKVYRILVGLFMDISKTNDDRASNAHYSLSDSLKSCFAIFSMKCPSLFVFSKRIKQQSKNISKVYQFTKTPSDNGLRKILDRLNPDNLKQGFRLLFKHLKHLGILQAYRFWDKHYVVSIDGVQHYESKSIHCESCLSRQHQNGTTSYFHALLAAVIVKPGARQVFPLETELIVKQDGTLKNDCELNAFNRLIKNIETHYSKESIVFVMDALYACHPVISSLSHSNWQYVINVKEKGNTHLFKQLEDLKKNKKTNTSLCEDSLGKHEFVWVNDLGLNASHNDCKVNMLHYTFTSKKGEMKIFSWVSDIMLSSDNVMKVSQMGRSRWKIENETFNALKNQEYHFKHNYGHGKKHLCGVFATVMFLAFYVDQIQEYCCDYFNRLYGYTKTRAQIWSALRAIFKLVAVNSMQMVWEKMLEMYGLSLEGLDTS